MSDRMLVQPFEALIRWALEELAHRGSIFGIPRFLFYVPRRDAPYAGEMFGHPVGTPIGPAAGPHTQLAQNIVSAWLCGGRFIELKTVQIMDKLEIPRPCMDMEDEGYNVEWSQELRLEESASEYIKAWALIHILHKALGFEGPPGTVFNMSVGYNLDGIKSSRLTQFMDRLQDGSEELKEIRKTLHKRFPQLAEIEIPTKITDSVTLSTMHGCPPDEIEKIARYLLEERDLHTFVKLNPTLLGRDEVLSILHDCLGFREIRIPERVFEHDLQHPPAVELIRNLKRVAAGRGLVFGVKLSNTLAMSNHKGHLAGEEMYMSGRALYPVTVNLFRKLVHEFDGELAVSYSGGADALNVSTILACGACSVTAASDLLKPGGYARLGQWLENLEIAMRAQGATSLAEFSHDRIANMEKAAADALQDRRYRKGYFPYGLPKVESGLDPFDCIAAPCVEKCPLCQNVPGYACLIARGKHAPALAAILVENPFPGVTGHVCPHVCQTRCTRNNYEQPVAIRALKRFAVEQGQSQVASRRSQVTKERVAIVGSGPSGLSAAYFLALSGVRATVFEARGEPGGMLTLAPAFRLPPSVVRSDIARIQALGVDIILNHPIAAPDALLGQGFAAVYVASGFQADARLGIEGEDGIGVWGALGFLREVSVGKRPQLGSRVLVIGGGNTAMDAARTAQHLTGRPVTVVYRRTRAEMPAEPEEVDAFFTEGNILLELVSPKRIVLRDGRVVALECLRNRLGELGPDGRRSHVPVPGSGFEVPADTVIVAVGQRPDTGFLKGSGVVAGRDGRIAVGRDGGVGVARVYAGGDAVRGPATIVEACADGRRAAEAICQDLGVPLRSWPSPVVILSEAEVVRAKRARARIEPQRESEVLPLPERGGFDLVAAILSEDEARAEASRCVQCSTFCDKCVEVCPNRANLAYDAGPVRWVLPLLACADGRLTVVAEEAFEVRQLRQIVHVDDLCNECGNCATFCVHQGKPYLDKPRLFLREENFRQEADNAFFIAGNTIQRREAGMELRLSLDGETMTFEDERVVVILSPDFRTMESKLKREFVGSRSLKMAAEMAFLLRGLKASLPFLPGEGGEGNG